MGKSPINTGGTRGSGADNVTVTVTNPRRVRHVDGSGSHATAIEAACGSMPWSASANSTALTALAWAVPASRD